MFKDPSDKKKILNEESNVKRLGAADIMLLKLGNKAKMTGAVPLPSDEKCDAVCKNFANKAKIVKTVLVGINVDTLPGNVFPLAQR